jgi:hypothetical protein
MGEIERLLPQTLIHPEDETIFSGQSELDWAISKLGILHPMVVE